MDNATSTTLTRAGSGVNDELTLTASNGTVTKFWGFDTAIATPGWPKSITDRFGNSQQMEWGVNGGAVQLLSVTDAYGRKISYSYYGIEKDYQLKEIEDFTGRKLNFQYDDDGRLVAIVTPSILKAAEGNTFPGGTAYVFQYDTGNSHADRRSDLIKIWFPNETHPYVDEETRSVDVAQVYSSATPRYVIGYGQTPGSLAFGRVISETIGDPSSGVGGTITYAYDNTGPFPTNIIDGSDPIVFRTTMTDRNGNETVYDFNAGWSVVRKEVKSNRNKSSLEAGPYVTWTKYNAMNQPLVVVYPEGNSVEYTYESGTVSGISGTYVKRRGLLLSETRKPGNSISIPSRSGSNGQTELTLRHFYDPIYNRRIATIQYRGNPINGSTYWTPQNGGTTPTNSDRSRFATITYLDYQKNTTSTIINDTALQTLLGLTSTEIQALITHVDNQMKATDGTGGLPAGFQTNLGDINGDATGNGNSSGLPAAAMLGNPVKIKHPEVRQLVKNPSAGDPWVWQQQVREEIFTYNDRGQVTTHTNPEGNLTVYVRFPENDPEGDGSYVAGALSNKQYGRVKEIHVDADPADVMSLLGDDADLLDFITGKITRTNTPDVYQDLITRHDGTAGCTTCAYDALGNPLAVTDPRGFTTRYERNELGEIYHTIAPKPYEYRIETFYDANRNVIRVDTEDKVVAYTSEDPTSADYGKFFPTGSGSTAHASMRSGSGGTIRAGWFTNVYGYDLLDNKTDDNIDATGSTPSVLNTSYEYDANQNLVKITKPEGNIVEYDYDERDLRIAERVGRDTEASEPGAVTIYVYDGNGNLKQTVGPARRGATGNEQTVTIQDAFGSATSLVHTGDYLLENTYDGFDRIISAKDAVGNVVEHKHDPDSRVVETTQKGPAGGTSPQNRTGTNNTTLAKSEARFDEAGRAYEQQQNVLLITSSTGGTPGYALPSSRAVTHTGGGLAANTTTNNHTGTVTLTTGGESYVLTRMIYDRASRATAIAQDNTGLTVTVYDGANRAITTTDPLNNITQNTYDGNSNVVRTMRTEKCTITQPTVADEVFVSEMRYDCLNRLVLAAEQGPDGEISDDLNACCADETYPSSLISLYGYDSRNNQTLVVDPRANTTVTVYDGASRAVEVLQLMRQNGGGVNPPEANQTFLAAGRAVIRTTTVYDGDSRVTQLIDDRGAVTAYAYDSLDRQVLMTFEDGSTRVSEYNEASNVTSYTDENESVFAYTYDAIGRRTGCTITRAAGINGTTAQSFEYDGLSRMTFARDSISSTNADVSFYYDALGRPVEERQVYSGGGGNTRYATNNVFTSTMPSRFTFPQGRVIGHTYDLLYRRTLVQNDPGGTPSSIASWQFFGPSRVAETTLGNGLICTAMNNARTRSASQAGQSDPAWGTGSSDRLGYDGSGRMTTKRYLAGGINGSTFAYNNAQSVVGFTTKYDPASNKLFERHLHAEPRSFVYQPTGTPEGAGFDSINRLRQYQRGTPTSGGGAIDVPIALPNSEESRTYDLDGLGNWRKTVFTPAGGEPTTPYTDAILALNPIGYWQLNEASGITATDSAGNVNGTFNPNSGGSWTGGSLGQSGPLTSQPGDTAADFNGSTGHVLIADNAAFNVSTAITGVAWVKGAGGQVDKQYFAQWDSTTNQRSWFMATDSVNGTRFAAILSSSGTFSASTIKWYYGSTTVFDGNWHMVAFTWNSGTFKVFVDGVEETSVTKTNDGSFTSVHASTADLTIGSRLAGGASFGHFDGVVGQCALFNTVLTPTQISDLYDAATQAPSGGGGAGEPVTQRRDHNYLNQITRTIEDSTQTPFAYDKNGNLLDDGTRLLAYDALNRLIEVKRKSDNAVVGQYTYDAQGRRIRKVISNGGISGGGGITNGTTDFLYAPGSWQCCEERNASNQPTRHYVWGRYIDELIQQRNNPGGAAGTQADRYLLSEFLYNAAALTDASGAIVETYDLDPYGNRLIFTTSGGGGNWWSDNATQSLQGQCAIGHQGLYHDVESELVYNRARIRHTGLGRWIQREPLGYIDGMNFYQYLLSRPLHWMDPSGLFVQIAPLLAKPPVAPPIVAPPWTWPLISFYEGLVIGNLLAPIVVPCLVYGNCSNYTPPLPLPYAPKYTPPLVPELDKMLEEQKIKQLLKELCQDKDDTCLCVCDVPGEVTPDGGFEPGGIEVLGNVDAIICEVMPHCWCL